MKKRFKLMSAVLSAVMALSAVPAMAEETGVVESGSVIKETIKPANYAFAGCLNGLSASTNRVLVNTSVITTGKNNNGKKDLFDEGYGIYLYELYYYPSFEINNAYAVTNIKLNVERTCKNNTYMRTNYAVSDEFILEGTPAGEYYDTEESDVYETLRSYNTKNSTVMPQWIDYTYGDDSLWVADISDMVIPTIKTTEENNGKAVLNLALSAYGKLSINAGKVSLTVTYDESKIVEKFRSELSNASTAETVKAVAEKFSTFIDADTDIVSNMDYVYADIAKTTATTVYTFETFKTAIENGTKVYLKEITYSPDNYVLRNLHDGRYPSGIAVNTNVIPLKDDSSKTNSVSTISLKLWRYMPAYNLNNTDAIRNLNLNISFGAVGDWLKFYAAPVSSFPVSNTPAFYGTEAPEYAALVPCIESDLVKEVADGSVYADSVASIDYSSKIEAVNAAAGDSGSAVLLAGVASEIGGGGAAVKLFEDSLKVTYDMTNINDKYTADFAAIGSAADVKALVENYSDFTGADTGILKNMDIVYNGLFDKISKGSVYTLDTLKTAIEEIASDYIYTVEYDKPTDYYMYKYVNDNVGGLAGKHMLVNTTCVQFSDTGSDNYGQYAVQKFNSNHIDSYYYAPMLSYDIYNPQAVMDVKFTTNARRRNVKDGENPTYVAWNVSDAALTDAVPGEYKAGDPAFDTLSAWFNANRYTNQTEYSIPTPAEFETDPATTHITTMDIPKFVMNSLTQKTGTPKLTITFSQNQRHYTSGIDNNKLAITYDLSAVSEAEREYIIKGYEKYTTSEDKTALVDDGARVEIVQMKKDVPAASKAIIAAYNGGFLVKTAIADVTAPGFMKKTVLDLTGFADVTYDELKVMTWNGFTTMKPLATEFEIR